jgi:RNA polymerase sigma-70 factor (ECF subfamily)
VDPNQTAAEFQTTHWSLVYGARGDRTGLEHLLRQYWSPVYAFIRRQGYGGHDASDLTQEFLSQVVIGRDIVGKADPSRGRFRSFLKQSLRNFLIDQHRTHRHSRGAPLGPNRQAAVSLPDGHAESSEAASVPDELSREFDREWAATIVQITLQRLEDAARQEGLNSHWEAFRTNILGPTLWRTEALDMTELAKRVGAADAAQVSNMIQTMKRRFRRTLREVVGETVATPEQVEQELAELRNYVG